MAIPFIAGAATMSLLDGDNKPTTIINNIYIPLSEIQADLYMTTREFNDRLEINSKAQFMYKNRYGHNKTKPLVIGTSDKIQITYEQAKVLIENEKRSKKKFYKTILMTKGIGSLPRDVIDKEESRCSRISFYILCFPCLPCWIKGACSDLPSGVSLAYIARDQWNLLKI